MVCTLMCIYYDTKQIDVLPSKNQVQCIVIVINDVMNKSREQKLITKVHIVTYKNLILH